MYAISLVLLAILYLVGAAPVQEAARSRDAIPRDWLINYIGSKAFRRNPLSEIVEKAGFDIGVNDVYQLGKVIESIYDNSNKHEEKQVAQIEKWSTWVPLVTEVIKAYNGYHNRGNEIVSKEDLRRWDDLLRFAPPVQHEATSNTEKVAEKESLSLPVILGGASVIRDLLNKRG